MYTFSILADLGDPTSQFWIGAGSLVLSALAIAITLLIAVRSRQRKLLTYEVVSNSSVINVDTDVGEDLKLLLEGRIVTKVRLHVIKLLNAGNVTIHTSDYPNQLRFDFDSSPYLHPLVRCAIHRTEPENLLPQELLKDMVSIDIPGQKVITLLPPMLNPREAIFLKVLILADHRDSTTMTVIGQINGGGRPQLYRPPPTRLTWRFVVVGVFIAFVLGLLISNSVGLITAFAQGSCSFGSIQDSGSTSFYGTIAKEAQRYNASCPGQIAHITINESSSGTGLTDLESGTLQIANSELRSSYTDQADHQVAAIVFALLLNKSVKNISSLSTAQIQQIYSGGVTFWDKVDGSLPHIPIKVIGRTTNSGTHATFVNYVLGGKEAPLPPNSVIVDRSAEVVSAVTNTPGAIGYADLGDANASVTTLDINQYAPTAPLIERGAYPFWAIEHMYTHKDPDALTTSFVNYVTQDLQTNDTFLRLSAMDFTVLASHSS